ncbi:hypothetical protein [Ileibacterium valens]|nr:hypothetical protein [Ileibacterium valens]
MFYNTPKIGGFMIYSSICSRSVKSINHRTNLQDLTTGLLREFCVDSCNETLSNHILYHAENHFIRDGSKLNLQEVASLIYAMNSSSISIELKEHIGYIPEALPANSTFSEVRSKLSSEFFKDVHERFIERLMPSLLDASRDEFGFRFLAIDGYNIPLETFKKSNDDLVDTKSKEGDRATIY